MKFSHLQKIGLVFFAISLLPAYLIADWRYEVKSVAIAEILERENSLHKSADKLLSNCEKVNANQESHYDATHQICIQGQAIHEHTSLAMENLTAEKAHIKAVMWVHFLSLILGLNLLGLLIYQGKKFLISEKM